MLLLPLLLLLLLLPVLSLLLLLDLRPIDSTNAALLLEEMR